MRELFILISHLLVTLAKLGARGGLGAVVAESLAVKHQLLIMKRAQRRAPNLTSWDRLVLGVCALLVSPKRLSKMAVILKPSTLLCFHHDPVAFEQNRFASKEVDAQQAVLSVPDDGEPRRTITAWYRSIVLKEYASDDIFIDLDSEGSRYLLGNLAAAEAGISPLHLDNHTNEFF
jgi:hypothetical protein